MNMMDYFETMLNTLNNIEVHGKDNVARVLGCINATEAMLNQIEVKNDGQSNTRPDSGIAD